MLSPGSGNTVIKSKLISRRMFLITAAKAVVMVGLVGRLISLQINQATKYKSLSDKNRFREWKLAPERGAIKDFFDTKIASTEPLYQLHLVPENAKDLDNLFVRLKAILNITDRKVSYLKRVIKTIKSGWLAHGKNSTLLEDLFIKYTKANFCTTVSNCTSGIHAVCIALGLNKDHEVIVPAQTHVATAHAAAITGAKVRFADIDYKTGNILFSEIKKLTNKKTKCLIVVHMTGLSCEMDKIVSFCRKKKIFLIEDCAHGLGTTYKKKHVGNFGEAGIFSFYPTKQITTGEGGVIISNNKILMEKIKIIKSIGVNTPPEKRKIQGVYDVTHLGLNYRLTDFQAALAIGQMQRYKQNLNNRRKNAKYYIRELKKIKGVEVQDFNIEHSYFILQVFFKNIKIRNNILSILKNKKIGSSIHYARSVPMMSYYKKKYNLKKTNFINSENYGSNSISLPTHQFISKKMIDKIIKIIEENI